MDLEPAERNPAELRRTALILVAVMILGATFVLYAYFNHERAKDVNRPPITGKITRNLAAKNQHGKLVSLSELEGNIWFAAPVCVGQLDENRHALATMKRLAAKYKDRKKIRFVLVSIEGVDQGVGWEKLAGVAKELGVDQDPRWWILTTGDTKKQRGFIKDQLRLGLVSERDEGDAEGKWKFPSEVGLYDQGMHVRGRYDFKEAHTKQVEYEGKVKEHPELLKEENIDAYLKAVERLNETLYAHTDYVLDETKTGSKE